MISMPTSRLCPVGAVLALIIGGIAAAEQEQQVDPQSTEKQILDTARQAFQSYMEDLQSGAISDPEAICRWSRRISAAEQALGSTQAERSAAAEKHLARMRDLEKIVGRLYQVGKVGQRPSVAAVYYRLKAEALVSGSRGQFRSPAIPEEDR